MMRTHSKKGIKKNFFLIFILQLWSIGLIGQQTPVLFKIKDILIVDSVTGRYANMNYEFTGLRKYQGNDSLKYMESGVISSSNEWICFRKKNGEWYIRNTGAGKKWQKLIPNQGGSNPKIRISKLYFNIVAEGDTLISNHMVTKFTIVPNNFFSPHQLQFWFSSNEGIVAVINSSGIVLWRKDFFM